jgi:hypothetical protein
MHSTAYSVSVSAIVECLCYPFNLAGHWFWGKNSQVLVLHVLWYHIWYSNMIIIMISCCVPDSVVLLEPFPNNLNPVESFNCTTDFDLQGDCLVPLHSSSTVTGPCTKVCTSSTILQLYLVSHRCRGARVQCIPQGGVSSVLQHVWAHQSDSG